MSVNDGLHRFEPVAAVEIAYAIASSLQRDANGRRIGQGDARQVLPSGLSRERALEAGMTFSQNYLFFPGSATLEEVLRAYRQRRASWTWMLVTERRGVHFICTFGSLLPYLTGRTPHIVHRNGNSAPCCRVDPMLWRKTEPLVEEALADPAIRLRLVRNLPMAELPVVDKGAPADQPFEVRLVSAGQVCGVTERGRLCGLHLMPMHSQLTPLPAF